MAAPNHSAEHPGKEATLAQVRKMLDNPLFRSSDSSRQLLSFLADWSLERPGQHIKESEIAIAVFRRDPGAFDAQSDSVVRVQMTRLRAKILEYYAGPGAHDEIVVEIPKGVYYLVAGYRPPPEAEPPAALASARPRRWDAWSRPIAWLLAGGLLGCAVTALLVRAPGSEVTPHLARFWGGVLPPAAPLLVVFSNPKLSGRLAYEGLHYYRENVDSQDAGRQNLSYAGSGDPIAVYSLTHLFDALHRNVQVRSGALLSWAQAKESNLIFIGRPEQNPALRELPKLHDFYFKFGVGIVDLHPRPGEREVYACSERPYTEDHAVIALVPGLDAAHQTLILAGNTTYGSQAAAEFLTRENTAQTLLDRLGVQAGQKIPYFEALLQVRINNEVPVWSHLIAWRTEAASQSSWEPAKPDEQ